MSATWFILKSVFISFVIISFLQLKVGSENKTLELHFTGWMKKLSASKRIQEVAKGGKDFTSDVVKEFTTEDGTRIVIHESKKIRDKKSKERSNDEKIINKMMNGLKLSLSDLSYKAKQKIKEEAKKELEKEVKEDISKKLKANGIDPKKLEAHRK